MSLNMGNFSRQNSNNLPSSPGYHKLKSMNTQETSIQQIPGFDMQAPNVNQVPTLEMMAKNDQVPTIEMFTKQSPHVQTIAAQNAENSKKALKEDPVPELSPGLNQESVNPIKSSLFFNRDHLENL